MMGSAEACSMRRALKAAPALEDLLPELSVEEQVRLQSRLRKRDPILKQQNNKFPQSRQMRVEGKRDAVITPVVQHALEHYNTRHPGGEFDAVKPLEQATVRFRGQIWFHINFWARSRSSNKIKRFFAEVHYKPPGKSSVCSGPPLPVTETEVHYKPLASSSVHSDLPFPVPDAEVHCQPLASSSVCSEPPFPVPKAEVHYEPPASSSIHARPTPIVEVCTIIEEPLGRYRRSCAFCPGSLDILHPMGSRKFVCGNDKDRMVQQLNSGLGLPFTRRPGRASSQQ